MLEYVVFIIAHKFKACKLCVYGFHRNFNNYRNIIPLIFFSWNRASCMCVFHIILRRVINYELSS